MDQLGETEYSNFTSKYVQLNCTSGNVAYKNECMTVFYINKSPKICTCMNTKAAMFKLIQHFLYLQPPFSECRTNVYSLSSLIKNFKFRDKSGYQLIQPRFIVIDYITK